MADRSSQLLLTALTRAAADAAGVPLYSTRSTPGLFPTTAAGKQAAQRGCEEGYLQAADASREPVCTITEKGLTYLLGQTSPREVLEDFVRVLEAREAQVAQVLSTARQMQTGLEALRRTAASVLARITEPAADLKTAYREFRQDGSPSPPPQADPAPAILAHLECWPRGAGEDCPLPELYRQVTQSVPGLSIGAFHDGLRSLHARGAVYLHPWTGPMYEMPCPPFALLVGHEIAYYASSREGSGGQN